MEVPSRPPTTYRIHELTKVRPDHLSLGVPLVENTIQLGGPSSESNARLAVDISEGSVRVKREDGEPLQVELNVKGYGHGEIVERRKIFGQPVAELVFRHAQGDLWTLADDPEVANRFALEKFGGLLGGYAQKKQKIAARVSRFLKNLFHA